MSVVAPVVPLRIDPGLSPDEIADQVLTELVALGSTVDEVAETLTRSDCKGAIGEDDQCPIWWWLHRRIGLMTHRVGCDGVHHSLMPTVELPEAVFMFINRFDCERYPGLVR